MITTGELREIPLFADLAEATLAQVVGTVEDIHLVPGEYFAHEGDERSLFVMLDGHVRDHQDRQR